MYREQKHHRRCPGWEVVRRHSLLLLALAVCSWSGASESVARGADATSPQETETQVSQTTESESASDKSTADTEDQSTEQSEEQSEAEEQSEQPAEEPSDSKSDADGAKKEASKQAEDEATDTASQPSESSAPEQAKEMKQSESSAEDAEAKSEDRASVETERPVEVEPPPEVVKQPDQKPPAKKKPEKKCIIGATATLLEKQSELKFRARVDSGAKSCSLHVQKVKIEGESKQEDIVERMTENIGKVIHFEVKNGDDKTHILTSKIAGYVIIKNSTNKEGKRRYKVPLTFRWKHMEKEVLVTLTDRTHMDYPLLLGRNFLRGDFLVDVELDSDD